MIGLPSKYSGSDAQGRKEYFKADRDYIWKVVIFRYML